jgi:surface antigen
MMYGQTPRRIVIPMNAQPRTRAQIPRSRPAPRAIRGPESAGATTAAPTPRTKRDKAFLEVMPPELLDRLSQDEINLQTLVQAEALSIETGETVFWETEDRAGTALAEAPHRMGPFTCRVVIETLKIEGAATESRATACRTDETGWTLSF